MTIMMVLLVVAVVAVVIALMRRPEQLATTPRAQPPSQPSRTAEDILAERLARGEIEPQDFRERLQALREIRSG
jgi:putative membrane protein